MEKEQEKVKKWWKSVDFDVVLVPDIMMATDIYIKV